MKIVKPLFTFLLAVVFSTAVSAQFDGNPAKKFTNVEFVSFNSKVLNEQRILYIHKPVMANNKNLPVIFIIDGQKESVYKEALDFSKKTPHIIVGIRTVENRNRDLIPVAIKTRTNSGGAENFLEFITSELIPFVKNKYQANEKNILFGGSNGGLFTIYSMLEKPEYFNSYIASSPMIGHCGNFMNTELKNFSDFSELKKKKLYVIYGMKDHFKEATEFIPKYNKQLKEKFNSVLLLKFNRLEDEGHVPDFSLTKGLEFIYN